MDHTFYIAIEGPIGVGKTTLARILSKALNTELLLEVFEENPFLARFYEDRERYAFQTQIFFLLSRYRQQSDVIPRVLQHSPLVSDYLFAKDRIFAHLNLHGDELEVYEQLHRALAVHIPVPDLVVYLKASTDVLMERIAFRDRPYERNMSRAYIEDLRAAYERFFATYNEAPVLDIDTNHLNLVSDMEARARVIAQVRAALHEGMVQRPLPGVLPEVPPPRERPPITGRRRLKDFQAWHRELDREKGFPADPFENVLGLMDEVGELVRVVRRVRALEAKYLAQAGNREEARARAAREVMADLREEMADVLAYLLKLANNFGIDLEDAYVEKMEHNWERVWEPVGGEA